MDKEVIFKARRADNGEIIQGFFTKKKIGSLICPVIERIIENDNGDYVESIEIDETTLEKSVSEFF